MKRVNSVVQKQFKRSLLAVDGKLDMRLTQWLTESDQQVLAKDRETALTTILPPDSPAQL